MKIISVNYFHFMLMFMLVKIISGSLDVCGSGALWWGEGQADCAFKTICLFTDCLHTKKKCMISTAEVNSLTTGIS